ncbi:MAG: hypothetical protein DI539_14890, partial [Flavobacterium psychrophilum]
MVYFDKKKYALLLLFLLSAFSLSAQDFTVTAVPSDETCNGNGSIAFSAQNTQPGATVIYIVYYLGPTGTSTPVLVHNSSATNLGGQQDGVFVVEGHQYTGTPQTEILPSAPPVQVTIIDNTAPLTFTLEGKGILCGNDGEIFVNVLTGAAISYELNGANGTHIGPQASPTFTGLTQNVVYSVVVTNGCGVGIPHSLTLFEEIPDYAITSAQFPDIELPACDKLTIKNDLISTNEVLLTYPFQAVFTVTHFDGSVNVYNVTIPSGEPQSAEASVIIDYHYNEPCHYNIQFTDTCGTIISSDEFPIDALLRGGGEMMEIACLQKNIKYRFEKFYGPFTLEFINPPPGFNPADFNDKYPGPYTLDDIPIQFGDEDNPLPVGDYIVKIVDTCNRTPDAITSTVTIEIPEIEPTVLVYPSTCIAGGSVEAFIPGLPMEEAIITAGPPEFSPTYSVDVSQHIQNQSTTRDRVIVGNLPEGEYYIVLKDTCGNEYPPALFKILPYKGDVTSYLSRPDCEVGYGTVSLTGADYVYIEITSAPAAFSAIHPLPYEVTQHVNPTGGLYMDHLPPGQYKFRAYNDCDDDVEMTFNYAVVPEYKITVEDYVLTPHCGSFDIFINHQSTGTAFVGFYLQKLDETSGKWRNPNPLGLDYDEGTEVIGYPSPGVAVIDSNALKLTNNATNYNLIYPSGKYRVIKQFTSFGDGGKSERTKFCTSTLYEFEYFSDLFIDGAVSLSCTGNSGDVMINAVGVPPLTYKIVAHDGNPYLVDNGTNNIFSGLSSGIYTIEVSDPCNHTQPLTFNIADIPPLVYVPHPSQLDGMSLCDLDGDNKETFNISSYTPLILDVQDPNDVTITYHTSQSDAEQGSNPIPDVTNVNTSTATIYARATHDLSFDCAAVTWFKLTVNPMPVLTMKEKWGGCDGEDVVIIADSGYDYYEWSNDQGTVNIIGPNSITVSEEGNYTVTVKDDIGCEGSKTVQVVKSPIPVINTVTIKDWTDQDNVLTVVMEPTPTPGSYLYSIDNIHFQNSPTFNNLPPGQYTVYVKDEFDCGEDTFDAYILTYPKFFTPNGDGINEYWKIYMSILEPDMLVYIYDRYGRLITGFGADSKGWDGTLNGYKLPSTDY